MDILKIIILSISSFVVLFFLTKLMGNREMAQLSMFDYIISITIGSIAAEMSTALDDNFIEPLIAMVVYAIGSILFSFIALHSITARRFISGTSLIFIDGKVIEENLKNTGNNLKWLKINLEKQKAGKIEDILLATCDKNNNLTVYKKITNLDNSHDLFQ